MDADVLILGGGLAGLTAAEVVIAQGKRPLVLEAEERLGGRIETEHFDDGTVLEHGPSYIGPQQPHMQRLVERFGFHIHSHEIPPNTMGINHLRPFVYLCFNALEQTHHDLDDVRKGIERLEAITRSIRDHGIDAVADYPDELLAMDEVDLETWMDREFRLGRYTPIIRRFVKQMLRMFLRSILSVEAEDLSALYFFWYLARCGGFRVLTEGGVKNGPDSQRVREGYAAIVEGIARAIREEHPDAIRLGQRVAAIRDGDEGVVVETTDGEVFRAPRAVVALPLPLLRRIDLPEAVSEARRLLHQKAVAGRMFKGYLRFDSAWWKRFSESKALMEAEEEHPYRSFDELEAHWAAALAEDAQADGAEPNDPGAAEPDAAGPGAEKLLWLDCRDKGYVGYSGYTNGTLHPVVWTMPAAWHLPDDDGNVPDEPRNPSFLFFVTGAAYDELSELDRAERRRRVVRVVRKLHRWADMDESPEYVETDWRRGGRWGGPSVVLPPKVLSRIGNALWKPAGNLSWAGTESARVWGGYMDGAVESGIRAAREALDLAPYDPPPPPDEPGTDPSRPADPWWKS
jgi:monoamine oxidase